MYSSKRGRIKLNSIGDRKILYPVAYRNNKDLSSRKSWNRNTIITAANNSSMIASVNYRVIASVILEHLYLLYARSTCQLICREVALNETLMLRDEKKSIDVYFNAAVKRNNLLNGSIKCTNRKQDLRAFAPRSPPLPSSTRLSLMSRLH